MQKLLREFEKLGAEYLRKEGRKKRKNEGMNEMMNEGISIMGVNEMMNERVKKGEKG